MSFRSIPSAVRTVPPLRGARAAAARPRRAALGVLVLEDRTTPSTFTVLNLADSGTGSLRAAVAAANANPGADAIDFATTGNIPLTSGQLVITDSLTIDGPGESALTVSGEGVSRVFAITGAPTVVIAGLTVANGFTIDSPGGGIAMYSGTVTLSHVTVAGNSAVGSWGSIYYIPDYPARDGRGGGLYVAGGTLSIDQSTIDGNYAVGGTGGISSYESRGTHGGNAQGGGLYIEGGTVHVNQSTVSSNGAVGGDGGGTWDLPVLYGGDGGWATGGGFSVQGGTLEVRQSTISQNQAIGGTFGLGVWNGFNGVGVGGGLYIESATPPLADLDTYTVSNTIDNYADVDPDISGPYSSGGGAFNPRLAISDVSTLESHTGTHAITFTVSVSVASSQTVTVAYATADGSATSGSDYQSASGTLTFAPGETSKTISVQIIGDRLPEPNETFVVNLNSPTNAAIVDGQGVGTITDDEPRISISDVTKREGRNGKTTLFTFTVTLSTAYDQPVTMSFQTVNGTATTGDNDYVAKTGTLTYAPGETTKTITIEVKGDNTKEGNETFFVDLFGNSGNALLLDGRGVGTIVNDD